MESNIGPRPDMKSGGGSLVVSGIEYSPSAPHEIRKGFFGGIVSNIDPLFSSSKLSKKLSTANKNTLRYINDFFGKQRNS